MIKIIRSFNSKIKTKKVTKYSEPPYSDSSLNMFSVRYRNSRKQSFIMDLLKKMQEPISIEEWRKLD